MWSRKKVAGEMRPIGQWPGVLDSQIPALSLELFLNRKKAITLYFDNAALANIKSLTGIDASTVVRLAKRCVLPAPDGNLWGFRALIPSLHIAEYTRTASVNKKLPEALGGMAGALRSCLDKYPEVEVGLVNLIKQEGKRLRVHESKIAPKALHKVFLDYIRRLGVTEEEWPFTTKYQGYRSIQDFVTRVVQENFDSSVRNRESLTAQAHLAVGTGLATFLKVHEPYDAIQIDSYKIECICTVALKTPDGLEVDAALERLWLIAAVDTASSAVLSYVIVYRSEVTSDDVLEVIRKITTERWTPLQLSIPGLSYPTNAGLPSGVIDGAFGAVGTSIYLDGALAHLANKIHEKARRIGGFAINWGPVAHFERRPNIERLFHSLGKNFFRRLPSTTGSNPHNGRAEDAAGKAVKYRISAELVAEALDVEIAQHNVTPNEGLSFLTPLEMMRIYFEKSEGFLVRTLPDADNANRKLAMTIEKGVIRGGQKDGRRPYIQIDRVKYTNAVLGGSSKLVGQNVVVEIDDNDMRQVTVYLENGGLLGVLRAHGKWGLTKHTRRTRKKINTLISEKVITVSKFDDPIQKLLEFYSERNSKNKTKERSGAKSDKSADLPSAADITEIVRISMDADKPARLTNQINDPPPKSSRAMKQPTILPYTLPVLFKIKNR
jgi:putative transposase